MISKLKRLLRGEGGITGLETAIILIAFVVVAAVFAFTVLSAGVFSSEKGKEAVYAGLEEVRGSVELRGAVVATASTTGTNGVIDEIIFTVANVAGGAAVDFTTGSDNRVVIDYRDENNRKPDVTWSKSAKGKTDGDDLLEEGELFEITVDIDTDAGVTLNPETLFSIEMKPPAGGVLVIERRTPDYFDAVMDLQ